VSGATPGTTYEFKIEARNVIGYSELSESISIKAAIAPSAPLAVTTSRYLNDVTLSWQAPSNQPVTDFGDNLTSYLIYIRTADIETWARDETNCPGTDVSLTSCSLTIAELQSEPFNLFLGDSVYAKVVAVNTIGESPASIAGNGAVMFNTVEPDAPIDLERDHSSTTTSAVGLSWSDGAYDGGDAILDYRVSYDQGIDDWIVI
jgi:hypothetical protein